MLERDGSVLWYAPEALSSETIHGTVDLPADPVLQQHTHIDRFLDLVFDPSGLHTMEIQVREQQRKSGMHGWGRCEG